jgi:hypothetical protein
MTVARHKHAAILLPDGNVLIVGGSDHRDWQGRYASAEIYHGQMDAVRFFSTTTVLQDGSALILGGYDSDIVPSAKAWVFMP